MRTTQQIRMDYNNALTQADALDDLADQIRNSIVSRLDETSEQMHTVWACDMADKYVNKQIFLRDDINETAAAVRGIAAAIRTTAKNIYNAEMQAVMIVTDGGSGGGDEGSDGGGGGSW